MRPWRTALDWTVTIAGAIAIVLAVKAWVVNPYRIPSPSMEPTLHCARPVDGCLGRFADRVLADRLSFRFREPRRGEIVVFRVPDWARQAGCASESGDTFVKRLIGLPGDRVREDAAGRLWVNGRRLEEPYLDRDEAGPGGRDGQWHVPADTFFMVGDNRDQSCDSRSWGAVPRQDLIGRLMVVYWPPGRAGRGVLVVAILAPLLGLAFARWTGRRRG